MIDRGNIALLETMALALSVTKRSRVVTEQRELTDEEILRYEVERWNAEVDRRKAEKKAKRKGNQ